MIPPPPRSTLFPYTTLFRSYDVRTIVAGEQLVMATTQGPFPMETTYVWEDTPGGGTDRKSTRLNSSHVEISYAVFCLKKKKRQIWTVWWTGACCAGRLRVRR